MASKAQMPRGWRLVRLGDVAEINPRRPPLSVPAETPVTFLPMAAIAESSQGIVARESRPYSEVSTGYTYFEENDFLFSKITPCLQNGKHTLATGLRGGFGFGTTEFHVVRTSSILTAPFMFRALTQAHIIDRCSKSFTGTAGQQWVQPETLKDLPILLPPLPEQRAIAAVLDSIDDAIECTEAVIASTEQLRDSLLHELLTRGVPGWHTAWEEVPGLGTMPADWEVVRLGEACDSIQDGDWIESKDQGGQDYRLLQLSNLGVGEFIETGNFRWITQATFDRLNCTDVICGDVLVARMPDPLGRAWYVSELASRSVTAVDIAIVRSNPNTLLPQYLMYQFNSTESLTAMASLATGTTRKRIRRSDIEKLPLALPPLLEQQTIVDLLVSVEGARSHVRQDRQLLQNLKDSTADVLLTGRVRTV